MRYLLLLILLCPFAVLAQNGGISGTIKDGKNNTAIAFANVVLNPGAKGTTTDENGVFQFENLAPGYYQLAVSYVGYAPFEQFEIKVLPNRVQDLKIQLESTAQNLETVEVKGAAFVKRKESPLSLRTVSATEIFRNPGGNRDISKVLQSFPGVASSLSFRNDLVVRGGAPNENRFFLDGIEVPNINHFATQGSSGGPVGLINVNFIREVEFYAGAFPSNRGNALSSVVEFEQLEPNQDKLQGNFMLGSSDIGLTVNTPLTEKSGLLFSVRRSYLQYLFQVLKLPFLPTYNDAQFKYTHKIDEKNTLTVIGLGAIDQFRLNEEVNDGVTDAETLRRNNYILGNLPVNEQWNYTLGAKWVRYLENGYTTLVASRNDLNNTSEKYLNNVEEPQNLLLDYSSREWDNKLRYEYTFQPNSTKWNVGAGLEQTGYTNESRFSTNASGSPESIATNTSLSFVKYSVFGQATQSFLDGLLSVSLGIRVDANNYNDHMKNPLNGLSPRAATSYQFHENWAVNASLGRMTQLPASTALGYSRNGVLANQEALKFIQSDQVGLGVDWTPKSGLQFSLEGFHKSYSNYPLSVAKGISLANLGADFGVIGNELIQSVSEGKAYGVEFLAQQKLSNSIYGIVSYTWVRSEFTNADGKFAPSSWDNGHILNLTAGKKFKRNWELGAKFRLFGGAPYTPYDIATSSRKNVWDVNQQGVLDYARVNSERFDLFHALDLRIDKTWYFEKWSLNAYFDIQNSYGNAIDGNPFLDVVRDVAGNPVTDNDNPSLYQTEVVPNQSGSRLPSIGIMIDF